MLHSHFSAHVTDYTRYFTGREWVFHKLNTWLDADQPQVFLLTCEPGSGKSTLATRLVQMSNGEALANDYSHLAQGCLTFAHFCQALSDITLNPLRFVEFLSQQFARRYQAFALALLQFKDQNITVNATQTVGTAENGSTVANVVINSLSIGNLSARLAFDRLVRKPLEQLYTTNYNEIPCILVDALDEALTYDPDDNIVTLLGYVTDLPPRVRFLLTSRSDPRVLHVIGESCLDLIDDAPDNAADVRAYAFKRLQTLAEPRRGEVANLVATAGRGNFLYARYVLDDFLSGVDEGKEPSDLTLPEGLSGIYRQFLKRELGNNLDRWGQRYRPLLGVLAVARSQGLTRAQLAGVTARSPSETGDILRTCAQYLDGPLPEGPFLLYHESFRGFLLSDETYQADAIEANKAIADFFCKVYEGDWLNCTEDYALQYTPTHLQ